MAIDTAPLIGLGLRFGSHRHALHFFESQYRFLIHRISYYLERENVTFSACNVRNDRKMHRIPAVFLL